LCATCLFLRVTDLGESHSSTSGTPRSRLPVQNTDTGPRTVLAPNSLPLSTLERKMCPAKFSLVERRRLTLTVINISDMAGVLANAFKILVTSSDRGGVPDLSVSGDNFDWWLLTLTIRLRRARFETPMQSLNQLPMVTNLTGARSA
jgi:hypothetical protein